MSEQNFSVKKRLEWHFLFVLLSYTVLGWIGLMLFQVVFSDFKNPVMEWLYWRLDVIYFFYLCIGGVCIFRCYWKKPWSYLDEVIAATQMVYERNDHTIKLSEPLRGVEQQMNQIKMSVLLSQKAAKEAEDRKDEMVMYLAHDIRTPLTAVIGYLSLLEEARDMPAEQKEKYVGIALDKAERLEALIDELFEITRYHTASVQMKRTSVDLYALLSQVAEEFYPVLSARGNHVNLAVEENLKVSGDPEKLARVFSNLIKNAASYSYSDTEIGISAERKGENAEIVFKNHGQVIVPEQLADIFGKFSRLEEARLSDTGGAGLGLSIAKEIVSLHGGEITAQSCDDTVTFIVILPVSS